MFQGDSITDCSRGQGNPTGIGYPFLVEAALGADYPGEYSFFNRGISGNRIVDVYARIKADITNLKPDVMSLLIGVNDVWHEYSENPNGVDPEKFMRIYSMLIEEIKAELPDIKIMILEPFVLKGKGTEANWPAFETEVAKRAEKANLIAEKYNLPFITLQDKFTEAAKLAPNEYWLADGVHPTMKGHELIKREWLKAFNAL